MYHSIKKEEKQQGQINAKLVEQPKSYNLGRILKSMNLKKNMMDPNQSIKNQSKKDREHDILHFSVSLYGAFQFAARTEDSFTIHTDVHIVPFDKNVMSMFNKETKLL